MIKRWILNVIVLLIIAHLLSGVGYSDVVSLLVAGAILGIVNALVRPIILFLTFPITILTLGLFSFVVSALMLQLTALLVSGFFVQSFGTAVIAALLFAIFNMLISGIVR